MTIVLRQKVREAFERALQLDPQRCRDTAAAAAAAALLLPVEAVRDVVDQQQEEAAPCA